jgi:nitrite reductase/ring-hydroxylating ferredoxin subunit
MAEAQRVTQVCACLNRCAHIPLELDWNEGEFFDQSGLYLICSTYGATYQPDTGYCIMGQGRASGCPESG